jgi:hypothetical protein
MSKDRKLFYLLIYFLPILWCSTSSAQIEKVYVDLDKYTCNQGDTVFFKGYITQGGVLSHTSTNLYVNVYSAKGQLLSKHEFPIYHGLSQGQVIFKEALPTENYYLVAFTKNQLNYTPLSLFSVPVLVYNREKPATVYHKKAVKEENTIAGGTVKDITWITSPFQKGLSSLVEVDSPVQLRQLLVQKPISIDTGLVANIKLNTKTTRKCGLFPIDSTKDVQTLLLYEDSTLIGRQFLRIGNLQQNITVTPEVLADGYYSLQIHLPDTLSYYASISVEDANRSIPSPTAITSLHDSYTEDLTTPVKLIDTSYLSFSGKATREFGKNIKDAFSREIFVAGVRDTSFLFTRVFPFDEKGNFSMDSLFFFDSVALKFQINKEEDGRTKDVKLSFASDARAIPSIDSSLFLSAWEDDKSLIDQRDTTFTSWELDNYETSKMKMLQPAIVKKWKDSRKELDQAYTSGPFSEPSLYAYDLRNYTGEYNRNIFWYINAQGGKLHSNAAGNRLEDIAGHPVHYYVDEIEFDSCYLPMVDFDRIAYIKILESDFLSTSRPSFTLVAADRNSAKSGKPGLAIPVQQTPVNVLIYTRKGKDFQTMRGGLNSIYVRGYDKILPFSPNKRTLLWSPWEVGNNFKVSFNNADNCRQIRVKVSAITPTGKLAYCEKLITLPANRSGGVYQQVTVGRD